MDVSVATAEEKLRDAAAQAGIMQSAMAELVIEQAIGPNSHADAHANPDADNDDEPDRDSR